MLLPPRRKLLWPISLSPEPWTWTGTITGSFLQQESVVAPRTSGAGLPKEAHHPVWTHITRCGRRSTAETYLGSHLRNTTLLVWWFERKWSPKGATLLGGVALLEELYHCGVGFEVSYAQATPSEIDHFLLPARCRPLSSFSSPTSACSTTMSHHDDNGLNL